MPYIFTRLQRKQKCAVLQRTTFGSFISYHIASQEEKRKFRTPHQEGVSANNGGKKQGSKDDDGELIQRWHCRATPLQFAIITFPDKWIALVARCILGKRRYRRDCIGDFAIRLYGPRYDPDEKFVWWPIKLSGIRVSVAHTCTCVLCITCACV